MPTADLLAPLEELPLLTRDLVRATLRSGRALVSDSAAVQDAAGRTVPTLLAIRRTALQLHFFIARSGEEIIFFFFKKQHLAIRPLEANLQISLQAVQDEPSAPAPQPTRAAHTSSTLAPAEVCSYRLLLPPFLKLRPTAAELALYAPAGTTKDNGILIHIGAEGRHVLGIRDPEAEQRAAAVYTTAQTRQPLVGWPAEPFLELTETLRAWLAAVTTNEQEVHLTLPTELSAMSDVHATLHWFVEGYRSMEAEQRATRAKRPSTAVATIVPSYGTQEYAADIALCVDRTGRLATAKERQPISLRLQLKVRREQGTLVARLKLCPPDFLCSGALRDAFVEKLRSGMPRAVLQGLGMTQAHDFSDFLDGSIHRTVVLRTDRDRDVDTNIVVLPGTWSGRPRTLILQTTAKVDVQAQPVRIAISAIALRYDSLTSAKALLDDRTVTYFMRLATALKRWLAVLQ